MNPKGFTLIEILVGVAIFSLAVAAASGIFVFSLKAQRHNLAAQELLDQTSYLTEYMSRAIRAAMKDDIEIWGFAEKNCLSGDRVNYEFDGQCLKFRNYKNQCQQFCRQGARLLEIKDGDSNYLTSPNLTVNDFAVILSGESQNDFQQPQVSINLNISGEEGSGIQIQTTISQRNLDVRR